MSPLLGANWTSARPIGLPRLGGRAPFGFGRGTSPSGLIIRCVRRFIAWPFFAAAGISGVRARAFRLTPVRRTWQYAPMDTRDAVFAVQRSAQRAHFDHGWLDTYHSFSFADYHDPQNVHWGVLRVLNDDRIAPGGAFGLHPHRDMEIVTYVLSGRLVHEDSMGNRGVVGPGGVQYMSAGTGVRHSEANDSDTEPLHLVQMWVIPAHRGMTPQYGQKAFSQEERLGSWLPVASGMHGVQAPISIGQSASFF